MAVERKQKADYNQERIVELKSQISSVLLILESGPIIMNNSDIMELYFIEDIFKFCMVGKLVFTDRYNLLEYGPFTGNEKISIIYSVGDEPRELIFDIWKVSDITQVGPGMQETNENMITFYFVDPFFAGFTLRKYSRSWSDELYTNIMKDILNNMVFMKNSNHNVNIETSSNRTDFIIPYWSPQTAIKYLMRRAKGQRTSSSGYLCFNNSKNRFQTNLVTMNYLLDDIENTIDPVNYSVHKSIVSGKNKILEWWINSIDRNSNPRIRGGKFRGFDSSTKKLLTKEFNYSDGVDNTVMLGRKTLYSRIDDIKSSNIMVGDTSLETLENIAINDWTKRYNLQFIVNFIVEGDENRYAGQQIEVEWRSSSEKQFNDQLKGRYLIKSITHVLSPGQTIPYKQRLVCIKNAYHNSPSKRLMDSSEKKKIFQDVTSQSILGSG